MMDKPKNAKKTMGIWAIVCNLAISACLLMALIQSQEAYAGTKKVSGTSKVDITVTNDRLSLTDKTPIQVVSRVFILNSTDPDWDNASLFYVSVSIDSTGVGKDFWRYAVITHPGGEKTFFKSKGTWKFAQPGEKGFLWSWEGKGRFMRGTGKFERIPGAVWKFKGKGVGFDEIIGEWEIE